LTEKETNMKKLRVQTWVAVGFLGIAASMVAVSASANTCQVFSDTWNETIECNSPNSLASGSVNSSGNKVLTVWLGSGNRAAARGLQSNGSQVSTCAAIDDVADLNSVSDSSGCNGATHFVMVRDSW
jgi:hypothetical protein